MSQSYALVFPGQGSQYAGMGRNLAENSNAAKQVFEQADDALGFSLTELCFDGPAEDLQQTENTQPAILTVSIAALEVLREGGLPEPSYVAGHSLGEYSAVVAAGALPFRDAVSTVRMRGRYMQEATPFGTGAMAAILGSELSTVETACAEAAGDEVCSPANINSPGQIVIAGNSAAVDRAIELLKERGAKRAVRLNVSAPFHCALMLPAQERLAVDLARLEFADLNYPLVTNVEALPIRSGAVARDSLTRQVSSPVRWMQSVQEMIANGVQTFVEVGPGKVLSGLIRQIDRSVRCINVEDSESAKQALNALAT
jgi:[acyl-carrier-protein] S-malonyltransferase